MVFPINTQFRIDSSYVSLALLPLLIQKSQLSIFSHRYLSLIILLFVVFYILSVKILVHIYREALELRFRNLYAIRNILNTKLLRRCHFVINPDVRLRDCWQ